MEDDILIIGCDSDDEIDSTCSDTSSSPSEDAGGESDVIPRKRKREESQERRLTLGEELALTDSENDEGSEDQNEMIKDLKRRKVKETPNTEEAKAADIGNAIYSLGNYCPRMLRGVPCTKARCSWVHYMVPSSAVSQLYRILANRYASISLFQHNGF